MSGSISQSSGLSVDTIVCLYCRALIAFRGLPATRYSDHLRHEHNILVPDELQFSISRTLKKTFEKKSGVARIKLQSFSEASRLEEPTNIADHDFNRNQIISENEGVSDEDQNNLLHTFNDEEQLFERQQIIPGVEENKVDNLNNLEIENQCKEDTKLGINDQKRRKDEEGNVLPNISQQLNVPVCYVKLEKLPLSAAGTKPRARQRKKKPPPAPLDLQEEVGRALGHHEEVQEVPWYEFKMYKCLLCDVEVFLGSVDRHLTIVHNSDVSRYLTEFPEEDVLLSIPQWRCEECGEEAPWMHRTITHHLEVNHNHMDINQYYFKHILKIKNHDVKSNPAENEIADSIKVELPDDDENGTNEVGVEVEVPLKLPWYESSWHRCHICHEIFTYGYFVKTHIKRVHGMTQAVYFSQNPGANTKLADWTCQICGKKIKWMNDSIYRHLRFGHRMSKIEYQHKYVEDEESVNGNVTDETLTGDEGVENEEEIGDEGEIELPGIPEIGDASFVINSRVLNPFHQLFPINIQNDETLSMNDH